MWGGHEGEGEKAITSRHRRFRRAFTLAFLLLVTAAPAVAHHGPLPWAGGTASESAFERYAGQVASEIARRPVRVICNGASDWGHLAVQQRFDPVVVWGYVLFNTEGTELRPVDYMHLSEQACWYLDEFWGAPTELKGKACRIATRIEFKPQKTRQRVVKRVKVKGRWVRKATWVEKTVQVPVETPEYGVCADYVYRVFALQTLGHESMHLLGLHDEAQAECQGMQKIRWLAQRFGATPEQAKQMAGDYYRDFYVVKRPGTPYFLPGCPDPS